MSQVLRLRSDALFTTEIEGETVILDARSSTYLTTNVVGTAILRLVTEGATRDVIYAHVQQMGGIDSTTARRDTDNFLEELSRQGLLE